MLGVQRLNQAQGGLGRALRVCTPRQVGGRGPCSPAERSPAQAGWSPWSLCLQPSAPTRSPVPSSPGTCRLLSTSSRILSLGTFRYLSQLHTWKQSEGRVVRWRPRSPGISCLPGAPSPALGTLAAPSCTHWGRGKLGQGLAYRGEGEAEWH